MIGRLFVLAMGAAAYGAWWLFAPLLKALRRVFAWSRLWGPVGLIVWLLRDFLLTTAATLCWVMGPDACCAASRFVVVLIFCAITYGVTRATYERR